MDEYCCRLYTTITHASLFFYDGEGWKTVQRVKHIFGRRCVEKTQKKEISPQYQKAKRILDGTDGAG